MRSLTSSLTMLAVLLHVLLGCHAHQAHGVEPSAHAERVSHSGLCSDAHDHQPAEGQEEPCDEEQCDFGDAKSAFRKLENDTPDGPWVFALAADDQCCSAVVRQKAVANDHLQPDCSRPILYCVLRN